MQDKPKPGYIKYQRDQFEYVKNLFSVLQSRTKKKLYLNRTVIEGLEKLVKES